MKLRHFYRKLRSKTFQNFSWFVTKDGRIRCKVGGKYANPLSLVEMVNKGCKTPSPITDSCFVSVGLSKEDNLTVYNACQNLISTRNEKIAREALERALGLTQKNNVVLNVDNSVQDNSTVSLNDVAVQTVVVPVVPVVSNVVSVSDVVVDNEVNKTRNDFDSTAVPFTRNFISRIRGY